uniref:Protein kinase domain-containing protein n=1 Tax=Setaria italica TaxID=4555 RepID=K4A361_SETIT
MCLLFLGLALAVSYSAGDDQFVYSGFTGSNLTVDGAATVTPSGLLKLTNGTGLLKGHAFYPTPLRFYKSRNKKVKSFSVTFQRYGLAGQYLGLTNAANDGDPRNHLFAVELDTAFNVEFKDINDNHVGIDINSLRSIVSSLPYTFDFKNYQYVPVQLSLTSHEAMQVWVDYDGETNQIDVTIAPLGTAKPIKPLIATTYDLSTVLTETAYVGFSASTGTNSRTEHYVLGLSFGMGGPAPAIDLARLPKLPRVELKAQSKVLEIVLPIAITTFFLTMGATTFLLIQIFWRRRLQRTDLLEDWETEYGPHRFSYKNLFQATEGFKNKHLIGRGGFGQVYKGVLTTSKTEVAVKRVSHESRQGMREFIAEVVSIGRLRHRNIVQLLGYCRREGELMLVYEYMPNGSLDKYLYTSDGKPCVGWHERFQIIKGTASGLLYLHEYWEQVVIHRDIKASNVLLDRDMNGRLGDFGLARLYNHGTDPQTTRMAGTFGYIAPELARTGKASPLTDVFAFGILLLEIACGRRPIEGRAQDTPFMLVDWVTEHWRNGSLMEAVDRRLQSDYNVDEACVVLKLGLWCSHPLPNARPSMQQVMMYLEGQHPVPEFVQMDVACKAGLDTVMISQQSSIGTMSGLSGGR